MLDIFQSSWLPVQKFISEVQLDLWKVKRKKVHARVCARIWTHFLKEKINWMEGLWKLALVKVGLWVQ